MIDDPNKTLYKDYVIPLKPQSVSTKIGFG